jgi:SAM-dependent methyltransferase
MREKYQAWWSSKQDAGHRFQTEDWFEKNANELSCLFPKGGTLVDVGCGNAQLLTYLAPHYDQVVGIDFTPSMLEVARKRVEAFGLKNVRLELGDACQFPAAVSRADLILSNQVAQNLAAAEIRLHLQECNRVLAPLGAVGICGVPWLNLRNWYYSGGRHRVLGRLSALEGLRTLRRRGGLFLSRLRGEVMADGIGLWYSREEIGAIASAAGFDCDTVTAWHYEYRFHARLRRRGKPSS